VHDAWQIHRTQRRKATYRQFALDLILDSLTQLERLLQEYLRLAIAPLAGGSQFKALRMHAEKQFLVPLRFQLADRVRDGWLGYVKGACRLCGAAMLHRGREVLDLP
jgi:hypothetical protein